MKNFTLILVTAILLMGCKQPGLDAKTALNLIEKENVYPNPISLEMQQNDGERTAQLRLTDLEKKGIITIVPIDAAIHIDSPFFRLTENGKQYELQSVEKQPSNIIRVKLAVVNIKPGIDGLKIQTGKSGNVAIAEFPVVYSELSPFTILSTIDFKKEQLQRLYFSRQKGNWEVVQKPGAEFDEFRP